MDGGYITNNRVFLCPSAQPNTNWVNIFWTYGMTYDISAYMTAITGGAVLNLYKIAKPADYMVFADSICVVGPPWLTYPAGPNLAQTAGFGIADNIHLRHTGLANICFADGHVEACTKGRIQTAVVQTWDATKVCNARLKDYSLVAINP